jgi:hypothetical protein
MAPDLIFKKLKLKKGAMQIGTREGLTATVWEDKK